MTNTVLTAIEQQSMTLDLSLYRFKPGALEALGNVNGKKMIKLNHNNIADEQLDELINILSTHDSINNIDLSYNSLNTKKNIGPLLAILLSTPKLEIVNLSGNFIKFEHIENLIVALKNTPLKKLDLSLNPFGSNGLKLLLQALANNTTLKELNLLNNNIQPECAQDIAEFLQQNQTLSKLSLASNYIDDAGVRLIIQALENNYSLLELELFNNVYISAFNEQKLAKILERNKAYQKAKFIFNIMQDSRTSPDQIIEHAQSALIELATIKNDSKAQMLKQDILKFVSEHKDIDQAAKDKFLDQHADKSFWQHMYKNTIAIASACLMIAIGLGIGVAGSLLASTILINAAWITLAVAAALVVTLGIALIIKSDEKAHADLDAQRPSETTNNIDEEGKVPVQPQQSSKPYPFFKDGDKITKDLQQSPAPNGPTSTKD